MQSKETIVKWFLVAAFVVLTVISLIVVIDGWVGGHFESVASLRTYIASYGMWGPIVLALIQALQVVLPVLPGMIGCIVGAALFGVWGGFFVNYIGISAGSIAAYYLARRFGMKLINQLFDISKYEKYIEKLNRSKSFTWALFLSILLPLAPDDFLCYFAGLIGMDEKKFNFIILSAKPWCILFYCIFFAYFL